ncbi:MAG: M3 family oligoendopeptidase [Bacteroidia bacterium]|nr:M3 family oligoendopeptidase [Bacteroidia bacterium]
MENTSIALQKERVFLPANIHLDDWNEVLPFVESLQNRKLVQLSDLKTWLSDRSELDAAMEEELAWRYIRMNIDTRDELLAEKFNSFIEDISPKFALVSNDLNKKFLDSPLIKELDPSTYSVYLKGLEMEARLFREENIPLKARLTTESQKYGTIQASMEIEHDGKKLTMQKASFMLKNPDRREREVVFNKLVSKRLEHAAELDKLFDELKEMRNQLALNAGYSNFRDYMFDELGRFDYSVKDCEDFHSSVEKFVVPVYSQILENKKSKLGLPELRPFDMDAEPVGGKPLTPFESGKEMLEGCIACLTDIDSYFGQCIATMEEMGHLSLESQPGKAPGGFNYPLYETGVPFIFMNSVGAQRDLVTFVHEAGHAVHSFLTRDLELTYFKGMPSEVAELASMSMELITMEHWSRFYKNEKDLKKAKIEQLEKIVTGLVWIATVDKFQHWLYVNPNHTDAERGAYWLSINSKVDALVNWTGYEAYQAKKWQNQLHIYEVPFYYIEYGFAQLGALAVWQNYRNNESLGLKNYKEALSLGNTKSIPEVYKAAGVKFDFSPENISRLMETVSNELNELRK